MNKPVKLPSVEHDLIFGQAIGRWDEALALGNGLTGCLLWGNGSPLRFSLDRGDLWDLRLAPEVAAVDFTYAELIRLVQQGDHAAIRSRFDQFYEKYPYPTKLPAGRIELDYGREADRIDNHLELRTATAYVDCQFGEQTARVESFLHAVSGLGYIKLSGSYRERQLKLVPPDYTDQHNRAEEPSTSVDLLLSALGYPAASFGQAGPVRWFYQTTNHELAYAIVVAEQQLDDGDSLCVYSIASNNKGRDWLDNEGRNWLEAARQRVHEAAEADYAAAYASHCEWWRQYWLKSSVTLPDPEAEKQWYLNNYLFASCSRKGAPPMPLQGVWTADEDRLPPWKGDYHHDLNTELCYWHYLKANHLSEGESFLDFLWDLRPQAREFANGFFESPGINLPSVMTIDGGAMGGWPMYAMSITNQIWLCQAFDHYWLYTGDRDFLRDKAYVYFKETAECLLHWLATGEDGRLYLPVSSSPEVHNNSLEAWLTPNSNYDLALLIYLFTRLKELAERLDYENEARIWGDVLAKLPELAVNERSVLMVNAEQSLTASHRHFSHAMAIYPLQLMDYRGSKRDQQIVEATIHDLEVLGKGEWCGYSFAWAAAIYAQQGNGNAALYHLHQLWRYMCSPNGFHLNGDYTNTGMTMFHYRPFTLEGNFAGVSALQDMLLNSERETVRVFPAIPQQWAGRTVAFEQLRGEMGILVSARISEGKLQFIELYAEHGGIFHVQNDFAGSRLNVQIGQAVETREHAHKAIMSITLRAGETCIITSESSA